MSRNKRYGLINFIFDFVMICLTGGLWLLWLLVRYIRTH